MASGAVKCVLAPEQTEGPYYVAGEKLRRDITEGRPGAPLLLRLRVVDASTCKPIKGAAVDIWHCDALGVYSGFGSGSGNRTFMRGVQKTDATGLARFRTVWPGWYQGRTVHIHVKVHVGGNVVHTGQLYFPDPSPTPSSAASRTSGAGSARHAERQRLRLRPGRQALAPDACARAGAPTPRASRWAFTRARSRGASAGVPAGPTSPA